MNSNSRKIIINGIVCLAFLSIPIFSSPDLKSGWQLLFIAPFQKYFLRYLLLILFFYTNYFWAIPRLFLSNKKLLFIGFSLVSYLILYFLPELILGNNPPPNFNNHIPPPHHSIIDNHSFSFFEAQLLIPFLLMLALSLLLKINENLMQLKTEKLNAEVSYLKAQINPHFLFNTLNSLYALTLQKSDYAPKAVLKLSNLMRYVVTESSEEFVSLEKEINYIKDYIDLQKLRIDEKSQLIIEIVGNSTGKVIAPLLLIPFVENAFKYGINPDENSFIEIKINYESDDLILNVKNSIVNNSLDEKLKTETGLKNTITRLEYVYPNRHILKVQNENNFFEINLTINL